MLLFAELVSGQVQGDAKAKPNKHDPTSSDIAINTPIPTEAEKQASQKNSWGLLPPGADPENRLFIPFARHLVQDQKQFWTYPLHARRDDAKYFLPFLAFTSVAVASDSWITKQVPASPSQLKHGHHIRIERLNSAAAPSGRKWHRGFFPWGQFIPFGARSHRVVYSQYPGPRVPWRSHEIIGVR